MVTLRLRPQMYCNPFSDAALVTVQPSEYSPVSDLSVHFYRPQRSCGKVMFLHLSVILFTGGGCLADSPPPGQSPAPLGRHFPLGRQPPLGRLPGQTSPWADAPQETAAAADGTLHAAVFDKKLRIVIGKPPWEILDPQLSSIESM